MVLTVVSALGAGTQETENQFKNQEDTDNNIVEFDQNT